MDKFKDIICKSALCSIGPSLVKWQHEEVKEDRAEDRSDEGTNNVCPVISQNIIVIIFGPIEYLIGKYGGWIQPTVLLSKPE